MEEEGGCVLNYQVLHCGILKFPLLSSCLSKAQLTVSIDLPSQYKLSEQGQAILLNVINSVEDNESSAWVQQNQGLIRIMWRGWLWCSGVLLFGWLACTLIATAGRWCCCAKSYLHNPIYCSTSLVEWMFYLCIHYSMPDWKIVLQCS